MSHLDLVDAATDYITGPERGTECAVDAVVVDVAVIAMVAARPDIAPARHAPVTEARQITLQRNKNTNVT